MIYTTILFIAIVQAIIVAIADITRSDAFLIGASELMRLTRWIDFL